MPCFHVKALFVCLCLCLGTALQCFTIQAGSISSKSYLSMHLIAIKTALICASCIRSRRVEQVEHSCKITSVCAGRGCTSLEVCAKASAEVHQSTHIPEQGSRDTYAAFLFSSCGLHLHYKLCSLCFPSCLSYTLCYYVYLWAPLIWLPVPASIAGTHWH